jgi:hypothetical protein
MLSKKSFGGNKRNFLKLLMRFVRNDVRDHVASQKSDHAPSYRHYRASQRRSSPKITICEIFGVVRFSTFSTASANSGLLHRKNLSDYSTSAWRDFDAELFRGLEIDYQLELGGLHTGSSESFSP